MPPKHSPGSPSRIAVAGDVWVDLVGLKKLSKRDKSNSSSGSDQERRTHENRTSFLPGGALLVEAFVGASVKGCDLRGHTFGWPAVLNGRLKNGVLTPQELIKFAVRLTPEELPRSL